MVTPPVPPLPLWKLMVLELFRQAVRVVLRLHRLSVLDLRCLLDTAIVGELKAQGYSNRQIAVELGCSTNTVKNYLATARGEETKTSVQSLPRRFLETLARGPVRDADPELKLKFAKEDFDAFNALTRMLARQGLIEAIHRRQSTTWQLTSEGRELLEHPLDSAWNRLEGLHRLECRVLERLHSGPCTREELAMSVEAGTSEIEVILTGLQSDAALLELTSPAGVTQLSLPPGHHLRVPDDHTQRVRTGLVDFLEKTGRFVDSVLQGTEARHIGQRALVFQARPEELELFIIRNRERMLLEAAGLEQRACEHPDARLSLVIWGICPLGDLKQPLSATPGATEAPPA